jgi:hypothetical protein
MQIKQDNIAVEESGGGRTLSISEGNQPQWAQKVQSSAGE